MSDQECFRETFASSASRTKNAASTLSIRPGNCYIQMATLVSIYFSVVLRVSRLLCTYNQEPKIKKHDRTFAPWAAGGRNGKCRNKSDRFGGCAYHAPAAAPGPELQRVEAQKSQNPGAGLATTERIFIAGMGKEWRRELAFLSSLDAGCDMRFTFNSSADGEAVGACRKTRRHVRIQSRNRTPRRALYVSRRVLHHSDTQSTNHKQLQEEAICSRRHLSQFVWMCSTYSSTGFLLAVGFGQERVALLKARCVVRPD